MGLINRNKMPVRYAALLLFLACLAPCANAQVYEEKLSRLQGDASVFTALTHDRIQNDEIGLDGTDTEASIGISGNIAGEWLSGANQLILQYAATAETSRNSDISSRGDDSSITGISRFINADPINRYDFNLGHTIRTTRNDTGFVINPSSYDTQNAVNAGAGLRFWPGPLTTLRLSADGARAFGGGDGRDSTSYIARASLERRLSERSFGSVTGSRSWSDEEFVDLTIDTVQLGYRLLKEQGTFSFGIGVSEAETEFPDDTSVKNDAITGYLTRDWVTSEWSTSISYNRTLSDSAIDLVLFVPEIQDFPEQNVRLTDLVLTDRVEIQHVRRQICSVCDFTMLISGASRESQQSGETTHEFRTGVNLGIALTNLQRLDIRYIWQAETEENASEIVDQVHRIYTRWSRRLAEHTSFAIDFDQSYLSNKSDQRDEQEFVLRLVLTHGFAMSGRDQ